MLGVFITNDKLHVKGHALPFNYSLPLATVVRFTAVDGTDGIITSLGGGGQAIFSLC